MNDVFSSVRKAADWPRKKVAGLEVYSTLGSIGALNVALVVLAFAPFAVAPGISWVLFAVFGVVAVLEVPKLFTGWADIYGNARKWFSDHGTTSVTAIPFSAVASVLHPRNAASYLIIFGATFGSIAQFGLAIGSIATLFAVSAKLAALAPFVFGAALTLVAISSWRGVAQHLANKEWPQAAEAAVLATIGTVVTVATTIGLFAGAGIGLTNPHLAPIGFGVAAVSCAALFSYVAVRFAAFPHIKRAYNHVKNRKTEKDASSGGGDSNTSTSTAKPPVEIVIAKKLLAGTIGFFSDSKNGEIQQPAEHRPILHM